jgi:hypothetical protein
MSEFWRPGTSRLPPRDEMLSDLRRSHQSMRGMFFHEAPAFDDVLDRHKYKLSWVHQ